MTTGVIGVSRGGPAMRLLDVTRMEAHDVDPMEVCHGLSGITRYGGLCANGKAPTVAQHTVEGAEWAYGHIAPLRGAEDAWTATRYFIVHDWHEAYIGDVRAPLKAMPEFAPLRALEKRLDAVIRKRMGLAVVAPDWVDAVVAEADREDARREQRWLLPPHACWGGLGDVKGMPKFAWGSEMAKSRLVQLVEKFWGAEVWR